MQQPTKNLSVERFTKPQADRPETTGEAWLTDADKELVNYIFHKVRETWGNALYTHHVGDEDTLRVKKRDWAKDLLSALNCKRQNREPEGEWLFRAKDKIDRVFTAIRHHHDNDKKNWTFPDLRKVCSEMANFVIPPAHRPFQRDFALEDKSKSEAAKAAGERELARMRKSLGLAKRGAM